MTLEAAVSKRISGITGTIGVYWENTVTGESFSINGSKQVIAASVIKMCVMAEAFRQFEQGELQRDVMYCISEHDKLPSCGALNYMHTGLCVTYRDLV